jgi:uncharacterized protein YegL
MSLVMATCALWAGPGLAAAQDGFGGSRTNGLVRDQAAAGMVPTPDAFTVEGMFAEHHFPVRAQRCSGDASFCVLSAIGHGVHRPTLTPSAYLLVEPVSGAATRTREREPQNLALVVDRSGSMEGWKLGAALRAAQAIVDHHGPSDRVSIVSFDDVAEVHHPSTPVTDRALVHRTIDSIVIRGGTNLHGGLSAGFEEVARNRRPGVADRVFVLTDEQPNVGETTPEGFLSLVGHHARDGVGLSIVGVGLDMGAALAGTMSRLEGGSYHYLEGPEGVPTLFGDDFASMLLPVAYRVSVTVVPGPGLRVADVLGVPSDDFVLRDDGTATLRAATVFFDRRRSGAVVRLVASRAGASVTDARATVRSTWTRPDGRTVTASHSVRHVATDSTARAEFASSDHYRAYALANFAQLLRASLWRWRAGERGEARRILTNARDALDVDAKIIRDPRLERERELAESILGIMGRARADARSARL